MHPTYPPSQVLARQLQALPKAEDMTAIQSYNAIENLERFLSEVDTKKVEADIPLLEARLEELKFERVCRVAKFMVNNRADPKWSWDTPQTAFTGAKPKL